MSLTATPIVPEIAILFSDIVPATTLKINVWNPGHPAGRRRLLLTTMRPGFILVGPENELF